MANPFQDFGRLLGAIFRYARLLSLGVIALFLLWAGFRIAEGFRACAAVHPLLGWAFLLAAGLVLAWAVGRPLYRFLRLPAVIRPPRLPEPGERTPRDLARHLAFVERYVRGLGRNPEWQGSPDAIDQVVAECHALEGEAHRVGKDGLPALEARIADLEQVQVQRLLAPLDRKATEEIRAEAVRVGIATAVSPYGNLDAFLVLWRSMNLVARIGRIYYGRPGIRGTLQILRDVSGATLAGAYLQNVSELAGEAVASFAGKAAGVLAGPLLDGSLNAVGTLRIGYLAKARCRAFSAWTEKSRARAVKEALVEAAHISRGVVSDLVRTVGGGLLALPARAVGKIVEKVSALFRRTPPESDATLPA